MEYVQGTNLREYIIKKGALDLPLAFSIMRQTGQAIGAAGEVGLVHRDVKPENILMTKKGRVKVADFGLCRDQESDRVHLTQSGVTMGTPLYMSPEQAQGHAIDHRGDLYSLGVTFYHMLAGVPPFHAETALALALKQVREAPRSMLIHRPDLPPELDRLVLKLMAKDPADRYQSAAEMLADLAKIRDSLQIGGDGGDSRRATRAARRARADDSRSAPIEQRRDRENRRLAARTAETRSAIAASIALAGVERSVSPEPARDHRDVHGLLARGRDSRLPRPQPGRPGRPGGCHRALPGPLARAALESRSPSRTVPKSSSATRSCKRPPTSGSPAFLAVVGLFPALSRAGLEGLHPARADLVPPRRSGRARHAGSRAVAVERREEARSRPRRCRAHRHQAQERRLRGRSSRE